MQPAQQRDARARGTTHARRSVSCQTRIAIQRRHGLYLSDAVKVLEAAHAEGRADDCRHDLLGDRFYNTDDCNTRHHEHSTCARGTRPCHPEGQYPSP